MWHTLGSVTDQVATDEPLSSCGTTIRRQEAVESTDGLKDLAP